MHVAKIMGRNAPPEAMLLILATITRNASAVAKLGVRGTPVTHPPALPPYRKVQYSNHHGEHTLAEALTTSCAELRINILLAHLINTVFGSEGLSNNAVE